MKAKLTKSFVDALQPDPDPRKRLTVWDTELPGFGITVTPPGKRGGSVKSYIVQYRPGGRGTPTRRVTIGRHGPEWQPSMARDAAGEILRMRRSGIDPFEERRRRREQEDDAKAAAVVAAKEAEKFAYEVFRADFIDRYARERQPRSWKLSDSALKDFDKHFDGQRVDRISRAQISEALEELKKRSPSAAIAGHKALRKMFNWANAETIIAHHPMREMPAPAKTKVRKRVLSTAEIIVIWKACEKLGYPWGRMYQLILCTGLRITDVSNAPWREYNAEHDALIIPAERMKRPPSDVRGDFLVPLNVPAQKLIEDLSDDFIFTTEDRKPAPSRPIFTTNGKKPVSGFSYSKGALDAQIDKLVEEPLPRWTTHDMRRTMSTAMQALGVPGRIIDRMQDHRDREQTQTALHYQHWQFLDEKRAAAKVWGEYLIGAIDKDRRYANLVKKVDSKLVV